MLKTAALLALLLGSFSAPAQAILAPHWAWARPLLSFDYDQGHAVAVDDRGRLLLAGSVARRPTMVCYDTAGAVIWTATGNPITAFAGGEALGAATDGQGNFLVSGNYYGTMQFDTIVLAPLDTVSNSNGFLAKYSPSGQLLWLRRFVGEPRRLGADRQGNSYVTGRFSGGARFGPDSIVGAGGEDAFVAKFDAQGTPQWGRNVTNGGSNEWGFGVAADNAGHVYATGWFGDTISAGGAPLTAAGGTDGFVVKLDAATGAVQWLTRVGSTAAAAGQGVAADSASVYVAGYVTGPTSIAGVSFAVKDTASAMFLLRLDPATGAPLWVREGGRQHRNDPMGAPSGINGGGGGFGLTMDRLGDVYVCGSVTDSAVFSGVTVRSNGFSDVLVAKYSAQGVLRWVEHAGSPDFDVAIGITVDYPGSVYVAGLYIGQFQAGMLGALPAISGTEMFVAKLALSHPLGMAETRAEANGLRAYPNPAHGTLTVEASPATQIQLLNALGQEVYAAAVPAAGRVTVPVSDRPPGLYIVRVRTSAGVAARRVVVVE